MTNPLVKHINTLTVAVAMLTAVVLGGMIHEQKQVNTDLSEELKIAKLILTKNNSDNKKRREDLLRQLSLAKQEIKYLKKKNQKLKKIPLFLRWTKNKGNKKHQYG